MLLPGEWALAVQGLDLDIFVHGSVLGILLQNPAFYFI